MVQNQVDLEDAAVFGLFGLAAATTLGLASVNVWGYGSGDSIWSVADTSLTLASLVSVAALAWVVITNQVGMDDIQDLETEYYVAVIVTFVVVLGVPFIPASGEFVTSSDTNAVVVLLVESAGVVAISYMA